jgi:hypothetical protein
MAFCNTRSFIEDKMLKIHDLKKSRIYFTVEKGTFDDRFVLFYTVKAVTTTNKEEGVNKSVVVATTEKEIK